MFASFHSEGTIHSSSDKLNTFASDVLICSTNSLSSFGYVIPIVHVDSIHSGSNGNGNIEN